MNSARRRERAGNGWSRRIRNRVDCRNRAGDGRSASGANNATPLSRREIGRGQRHGRVQSASRICAGNVRKATRAIGSLPLVLQFRGGSARNAGAIREHRALEGIQVRVRGL